MEIVHLKLKHRPFCFSVKGHVKMLRLALTVTSMTFFIIAQAPEPYIVITGFEVTVIFFFILLYILRLDRLMKWLFWPLLDIINSLVTTVFMVIISVLALIPETTTLTVLGGGVIVGALTFFLIAEAHESFIAITVLESCIVLLFIITYMLTLHHLLTCLRWSLLSAKQQEADKAKYEQLSLDMWKTLLVMESSNHGEVSEGKLKSLSMENVKKGSPQNQLGPTSNPHQPCSSPHSSVSHQVPKQQASVPFQETSHIHTRAPCLPASAGRPPEVRRKFTRPAHLEGRDHESAF
ncbi:uncharacterized protein LOC102469174 isoform X3 [Tupaia chinensis]|uniref:uncharacterized protein LOC102469174 isoform X3 n=1 Tax=Tupaia chinensis TaxID=246437 RepID=UPI000FFBADA1|nr:uncharacterized protein LOC102469174 isoform X3 [Tupaia chinensis]